jgi:hypothetical protein
VWNVDSFRVLFPVRKEHLEATPLPQFKLNEIKKAEKAAKKAAKKKEAELAKMSRLRIANPEQDQSSDSEDEGKKELEDKRIREYKAGYRNFPDFEDDDQETKQAREAFAELAAFRPSLNPPPKPTLTVDDYFGQESHVHLGRPMLLESNEHTFSGRIWMYEPSGDPSVDLDTIPFHIETLFPLFSLMGLHNEHMRYLNEFLDQKLPPGFPVQVEIPIGILPLSCVISFRNIVRKCERSADFFAIPGDYRSGEVIKNN